MISSALALMLLAAPSPEAVARARNDYNRCLMEHLKKSLKEDAEETAFESGMAPACAAKQDAFRSVVVAVDTAAGIKRAAAQEGADMEVEYMVTNAKELFRVHKGSNTTPD